ncbi:MAG: hypothetical protein KJ941_08000 [Bacteroidetes bacterium]|nr:hypothetical protein [Bacteroidota bacterium]
MGLYNKIMVKFWLIIAIIVFALTTYKCVVDDYRIWIYYYVIVAIALLMYFMKKWMIKRMEKHLAEMEKQANSGR